MSSDSLIQFPCQFPIKVMGYADNDFPFLIENIIREIVPDFNPINLTTRGSKDGKYVSVTVNLTVHDQETLDLVYQTLSSHERVIMVL